MRRSRFAFARVQTRRAGLGALLAAGLLSACLVTSRVDYEQPIIPSVVKRTLPRPQEFARVPSLSDESCKKGYMQFAVSIRDVNLEEGLEARVLIDGVVVDEEREIEPTGVEERKDYSFCLEKGKILAPCSLLEVIVSTRFKNTSQPYETRDGDLASTHWWVIGEAGDNPNASYRVCPDYEPDAGVP